MRFAFAKAEPWAIRPPPAAVLCRIHSLSRARARVAGGRSAVVEADPTGASVNGSAGEEGSKECGRRDLNPG